MKAVGLDLLVTVDSSTRMVEVWGTDNTALASAPRARGHTTNSHALRTTIRAAVGGAAMMTATLPITVVSSTMNTESISHEAITTAMFKVDRAEDAMYASGDDWDIRRLHAAIRRGAKVLSASADEESEARLDAFLASTAPPVERVKIPIR